MILSSETAHKNWVGGLGRAAMNNARGGTMRLRSTKLTATAFTAVGALLGYRAASADLFRNAVASETTKELATERASKASVVRGKDDRDTNIHCEYLAGPVSLQEHGARRLRAHVPRQSVPAQRLWPVRHVGQRLAMVQRLVTGRSVPRAGRQGHDRQPNRPGEEFRSPGNSTVRCGRRKEARSSVTTPTARATGPAPAGLHSRYGHVAHGLSLCPDAREAGEECAVS